MDVVELARWQFAITTVYHFLFVPITIGLAPLLAIMHTQYVRTGDAKWRRITQFWGKLFMINFALGLVTGIVQEFQFGMNWSDYSAFVGDIFGAPLALEALLAFFLESTFLGVWLFGWNRLPAKLHLMSIWLVAIGVHISAFFILAANSFMQWPVGFELDAEQGRAELTDFVAVITNWHLQWQFPHVILASWVMAAFLVLGISAYHLARKNEVEVYTASIKLAIAVGVVSTIGVALVGHGQAQAMTQMQPMKMAAAEALWETDSSVGLSLFAIGDVENGRNSFNIEVPYALSFMSTNSFTGEVEGINDIQARYEEEYGPGNYIPPVGVTYWTFRLMVGAGTVMILLSLIGAFLWWRGKLNDVDNKWVGWFHKIALWSIALPVIANATGWIMTEVGRQPWVVFGLMRTEDGISPTVPAYEVAISLVVFTLVYGALAVVEGWLMVTYAKRGPQSLEAEVKIVDDDSSDDLEPVKPVIAY